MAILREKHKGKWRYRWQIYFTDSTGLRKRKSSGWFPSRAECEEDLSVFQAQPVKTSTKGVKFKTVWMEWVKWSSNGNTKKTVREKSDLLSTHFTDLAEMNIFKITAATIKAAMEDDSFARLSTSRKNKILGYMRSVFRYAVSFHGLPLNPMDQIQNYRKTTKEKLAEVQILSAADFERLIAEISPKHTVYQRLFIFLYWTGMRLNEALSLTFSDIRDSKVKISRQWVDGSFEPLKTAGSVRTIAIDRELMDIVEHQYDMYSSYPKFDEDTWFVFGGYRHLAYTSIERVKNAACEAAGIPKVKIHSFRHSHASNLIAAGIPIFQISKRLGHSSVSMTMDVYGHLINRDETEILAAISSVKASSKDHV